MDEITQLAPRRCKATNRDGVPCGNAPSPFQEVCRMHGAGTPQAKRRADEFRLRGRDLACGVLIDAMNADPCEACGRTRDMTIAVRAAIATLDRTGMGPHAHLTVTPGIGEPPCVEWLTPEELHTLDELLAEGERRKIAGEPKLNDRIGLGITKIEHVIIDASPVGDPTP